MDTPSWLQFHLFWKRKYYLNEHDRVEVEVKNELKKTKTQINKN